MAFRSHSPTQCRSCLALLVAVLFVAYLLGVLLSRNFLTPGQTNLISGTPTVPRTAKPQVTGHSEEYAALPGVDDSSGQLRCAPGAFLNDVVLDSSLEQDTSTIQHPSGITFRTVGLESPVVKQRISAGIWETNTDPKMMEILSSDPNCTYPVFVDGGAAFGYYSIMASLKAQCREVQAFNPHPKFAAIMRLNLEDNSRTEPIASHTCINQVAISDHAGNVTFGFGLGGGIGYGYDVSKKTTYGPEQENVVDVTTLDIFFSKYIANHKKVLLVKLDVQGEELKVMQGASNLLKGCRVKNWLIGIHNPGFTEPLAKLLSSHGYRVEYLAKVKTTQPDEELVASC